MILPLLLIAAATAQPTLPDFPDEFTTRIEANFVGRDYSYVREEAWDYENNRVRLDGFEGNVSKREYYFFDQQKLVTILDGRDCAVSNITNGSVPFLAQDGRLMHARAMFEQVDASEYNFMGYSTVRGINCTHFEAPGQSMPAAGPPGLTPYSRYDYTIHWWWSDATWAYRGESAYSRPVRCMVQGDMICADPTNCTNTPFQNFYEFTSFVLGVPAARHFEVHPHDACPFYGPAVQKPIPDFPDEFTATIEGNFVSRNYSIELREFWDYAGNRVRMDYHSSRSNQTQRSFYFFDIGKQLTVSDAGCRVSENLGMMSSMAKNGQLEHARSFYERVPAENYTYQGQRRVRGILCDRFTAQIENEAIPPRPSRGNASFPPNPYVSQTYTISWYFSDANWNGGQGDGLATRPVRCEVEGVQFCSPNATDCTHFEFENYYEFTNFVGGTPDDHHFEIHSRYDCPYYLPVNKTGFPMIPNDYSMFLEIQNEVLQTTTRVREYYDYSNNRMRLERELPDGSKVVTVVLGNEKMVYTGKSMVSDEEEEVSGCESNPLAEMESFDEYMVNFDQDGHLRPTTAVLFGLQNYSWVGRHEARGYECDVYEGARTEDDTGGTTSYIKQRIYFAVPSWNIAGDQKENRAPIRVELKGTDGDGEPSTEIDEHWEIVNYEADQPDASLFEIDEGCPLVAELEGDEEEDEDENKMGGMIPMIAAGAGGLIVGGAVGYCATKVLSNPPLLESDEYLNSD